MKPVNQKAWFLVLPVLVLVAISAVIPLMMVVNFSVQEKASNGQFFWMGTKWYETVLHDEKFWGALFRSLSFSAIILAIVLGSSLLSFFQEYRASTAVAELKKLAHLVGDPERIRRRVQFPDPEPGGLGGEHFGAGPGQRESKSAEAGKQVGDRGATRQPFARCSYQRSLAVGRRLKETAGRKRHGNAGQRHGHRLGLPHHVRAVAAIERQPRQCMIASEIEHRFGQRKAFGAEALDPQVDPLVSQGQLDIGGHLGVDMPALRLGLVLPLPQPDQQLAQRAKQGDEFRQQHRAFRQFDQPVRLGLAEADHHAPGRAFGAQRSAAAAERR